MVDCAGLVRCISVECTLASRSLLDPNKAAGLGGHALFLPGRWERKMTEGVKRQKKEQQQKICIINTTVMFLK